MSGITGKLRLIRKRLPNSILGKYNPVATHNSNDKPRSRGNRSRSPTHHVHPGRGRSRSRNRNRNRSRSPVNLSILSSLQNRATRKKLTPSQQERIEEYYRPKNYTVYQYGDEAIETMLAQRYVKVGDTITYQANKHQNTVTYMVVYKDLVEQTGKKLIVWRTYYNM